MHLQMIIAEGEKVGQVDISGPQGNLGSPPNQPTPLRICSLLDCNSTHFIAKRSLLTPFIL